MATDVSGAAPVEVASLSCLDSYLDPITVSFLGRLEVFHTGPRSLALGHISLEVTQALTAHVGPSGTVTVAGWDPTSPLIVPGRYSLIHSGLLFSRSHNRRVLLRRLADSLAPGGWLVIGEFRLDEPLAVMAAHRAVDAKVFARVADAAKDLLGSEYGVQLGWAGQVHAHMVSAGLQRTRRAEYAGVWAGGEPACELLAAVVARNLEAFRRHGLTDAEIEKFCELMGDPRFAFRTWPVAYVRGQRPVPSIKIWVP